MNADLRRGQDTIPVTEIAVRLGIGINQAYAGLAAGQLPGRKVGKRWIIPRARSIASSPAPTRRRRDDAAI